MSAGSVSITSKFWVVVDIWDVDQLVLADGIPLGSDVGLLATATVGTNGVDVPARFRVSLDLRQALTRLGRRCRPTYRDPVFIFEVGPRPRGRHGPVNCYVVDATLAIPLALSGCSASASPTSSY